MPIKWAAVKRKRLIFRSIFKALAVIEVSLTVGAVIIADTDRQVSTASTVHCIYLASSAITGSVTTHSRGRTYHHPPDKPHKLRRVVAG